jgi:hypothetical protein
MLRHILSALLVAALAWGLMAGRASAAAQTMQPTTYDDGLACPGGCDPHVVFHKRHNRTENAFRPPLANQTAAADHPCVSGQSCMICFDASDASCIEVLYRGNGPPEGRFDFTSSFMVEACGRAASQPATLRRECEGMARTAAKAYGGKLSCIAHPNDPACTSLIAEARAAQVDDRPEFLSCRKRGVVAYNKAQTETVRRRSPSNGCAYAENLRATNSHGESWQRLMPGACRDGTFVGRDGLDCCIGVPPVDASHGSRECAPYYH